jgi:hypothetical protein
MNFNTYIIIHNRTEDTPDKKITALHPSRRVGHFSVLGIGVIATVRVSRQPSTSESPRGTPPAPEEPFSPRKSIP